MIAVVIVVLAVLVVAAIIWARVAPRQVGEQVGRDLRARPRCARGGLQAHRVDRVPHPAPRGDRSAPRRQAHRWRRQGDAREARKTPTARRPGSARLEAAAAGRRAQAALLRARPCRLLSRCRRAQETMSSRTGAPRSPGPGPTRDRPAAPCRLGPRGTPVYLYGSAADRRRQVLTRRVATASAAAVAVAAVVIAAVYLSSGGGGRGASRRRRRPRTAQSAG